LVGWLLPSSNIRFGLPNRVSNLISKCMYQYIAHWCFDDIHRCPVILGHQHGCMNTPDYHTTTHSFITKRIL
jgi:hypothetical protein